MDQGMRRKVERLGESGHEDVLGFPKPCHGPSVLPPIAEALLSLVKASPVPPEMEPLPEQRMYKWAFDLVANKVNWKLPVDAMVDAPRDPEDRELFKTTISRAVVFYAGCVPIIVDLGDKCIGVKAVGYYKAVGA